MTPRVGRGHRVALRNTSPSTGYTVVDVLMAEDGSCTRGVTVRKGSSIFSVTIEQVIPEFLTPEYSTCSRCRLAICSDQLDAMGEPTTNAVWRDLDSWALCGPKRDAWHVPMEPHDVRCEYITHCPTCYPGPDGIWTRTSAVTV